MPSDIALPKVPGYVPDPFDPRDYWLDEIAAGSATSDLPARYKIEDLEFEPQGSFPFCVSFAVTKMVEYAYRGKKKPFEASQPHLFFRSGGQPWGSGFRANLDTAKGYGCIAEEKLPMPSDVWGNSSGIYESLKNKAFSTDFEGSKKILGYARVSPTEDELKRAIMEHGPVMVGVAASGGYWTEYQKRSKNEDNHACLLVGWDENGWIMFDSLQPSSNFNGYHKLDKSYQFFSAYVVTELPKNVENLVETVRSDGFENALNHYGQRRNLEAEQMAAAELLAAFNRFNNQSVKDAAGRFWTVLTNARAYGGYNVSYTKWGMWQPGDLVNFVYQWRRTGEYLFDLNQPRKR